MKLKKVQVMEFRSVWDTGEFEVGNITCLVGKNEAGDVRRSAAGSMAPSRPWP